MAAVHETTGRGRLSSTNEVMRKNTLIFLFQKCVRARTPSFLPSFLSLYVWLYVVSQTTYKKRKSRRSRRLLIYGLVTGVSVCVCVWTTDWQRLQEWATLHQHHGQF